MNLPAKPELNNQFQRYYEPATVPHYLVMISGMLCAGLHKKGLNAYDIRVSATERLIMVSRHNGYMSIFKLTCINNIIEWRKVI